VSSTFPSKVYLIRGEAKEVAKVSRVARQAGSQELMQKYSAIAGWIDSRARR
jgi:hypothetical protein